MSPTAEAALKRLTDLEAIRDLPRRYARAVWRADADGAAALFTADGVMDLGDGAPLRGRDAIRAAYRTAFAGQTLMPYIHNHLVELDGDTASGHCDLDLHAALGGRAMIGAGTYADRYARTPEGWRFVSRHLDLRFLAPLAEGWAAATPKARF